MRIATKSSFPPIHETNYDAECALENKVLIGANQIENEEIDEIDIPVDEMLGADGTAKVQSSGSQPEIKARVGSIPIPSPCPLGQPDGSPGAHIDHDTIIREYMKMASSRTNRILAERVIRLERAIQIIMQWVPTERQIQIENQLQIHRKEKS